MKRCRHTKATISTQRADWSWCQAICAECNISWIGFTKDWVSQRGRPRKPPKWVASLVEIARQTEFTYNIGESFESVNSLKIDIRATVVALEISTSIKKNTKYHIRIFEHLPDKEWKEEDILLWVDSSWFEKHVTRLINTSAEVAA